jgi:uncharacterized protein YuzB (UPF0349 family)
MIEIFFCENNVSKGLNSIIDELKMKIEDAEIYIETCLGLCTDCAEIYYAIVESDTVYADSPEELYDKIMAIYEEIEDI